MMGYFDGLVDGAFKKDSQGRTLFYPWGILGSGYVVDSEEKKNTIREFYKKMYMIMLPAVIIIQLLIGFWVNLVLLPIYIVWYYHTSKKITNGLERTGEKLKVSEAYANSAKSHNLGTLIFLEITSVIFVLLGILLIFIGPAIIGYLAIALFGLCGAAIGYMINVKIKDKS